MLNTVVFNELPLALEYVKLPGVPEADIWLRRNIQEATERDDEGNAYPVWIAEEAYIRTTVDEAEVAANFDRFFEYAAAWDFRTIHKPPLTADEKIALLEAQNKELTGALIDTELALCELFETLGGV
ncbi:MAG: hypothetical protein IKZ82_10490 [Clostridia bacterium]|nr:hypothetical protein [Clostridia bacterium]